MSAQLNNPHAVITDSGGNLYIADTYNHRIRKIDPAGIISTIAGTGSGSFGGDGGPAIRAQLFYPEGLALDSTGNIFVADSTNHRIRKIDRAGIITTVAGTGVANFGGDGGPATAAQVNYPMGVALDADGNMYIADYGNHRVRKVDRAGIITTAAGTGVASFGGDGGPATAAQVNSPRGVAIDTSGNLLIADTNNSRIRKVDRAGVISTIAGTGRAGYNGDGSSATSVQLNYPWSITV
jgi:sugar lactone lactonase YvrE